MVAKPATVCAPRRRKRTIYLPSTVDEAVYSTLQRSIADSMDEDLVVDVSFLGGMESQLIALLRSAMSALNADRRNLTVVRSSGGVISPVAMAELELAAAR